MRPNACGGRGVRTRGAFGYVVTKGLFFLLAFPALGVFGIGWEWTPSLLVEGWLIGLFWGTFIFMRKALHPRA
jgi:hypothetical protein